MTAVVTRVHRYKLLLRRRWWIPFLTTCLGLFVGAWMIYQAPNAFLSTSKMMLTGKLNLGQNAVFSEDSNNFYGTQIQLMQSDEVRDGAKALVRATHPQLQPARSIWRSRNGREPRSLSSRRSVPLPTTPGSTSMPSCRNIST
jgi:uncharacterized protein involved in exopolysaccharide biosynthesis